MSNMTSAIAALTPGNKVIFTGPGGTHTVSYYDRLSYGDNGKPVRGATIGGYAVTDDRGHTHGFDHGPYATTPAAARSGANPNAKKWAAEQAANAITSSHFRAQWDTLDATAAHAL
jgi:hypothetical protein